MSRIKTASNNYDVLNNTNKVEGNEKLKTHDTVYDFPSITENGNRMILTLDEAKRMLGAVSFKNSIIKVDWEIISKDELKKENK